MISTTQSRILKAFSDLQFNSEKHWYILDGQYLPAVTTLIKRHIPPFDEHRLLPLSAMKASRLEGREVTPHELKRRWQLINTTACDLGTKTHLFLERYTGIETPTTPQEEAGVKYIKSLRGKYKISLRELRAYSVDYGFAGTMDLPLEVVGKEGELVIDDYKTNTDLFKAYDYMYPPFETLEASPYNADQLQLSYYQIMLEEVAMREGINIKVVDRRVIHLKADGEFRVFPLCDFTGELKEYMNHIIKYN